MVAKVGSWVLLAPAKSFGVPGQKHSLRSSKLADNAGILISPGFHKTGSGRAVVPEHTGNFNV